MANQEFTAEELANERWLPVVGYEAYYAVSSLGRVMRLGGTPKCKVDRLLKPSDAGSTGYFSVSLSVNNERKGVDVHLLVARAFIGPCPEGYNVNHKDLIKTNSRLENLEYLTFKGNTQHALAHGVMATGDRNPSRLHPERLPHGDDHWSRKHPEKVSRGETHKFAKLGPDEVKAIRSEYAEGGVTQAQLAVRHNVSQSNIMCIVLRRTWKHI